MTTEAAMLVAIRRHSAIGRGTCSPVDECWTDDEILSDLREHNVTTAAAAVERFVGKHNLLCDVMGMYDLIV